MRSPERISSAVSSQRATRTDPVSSAMTMLATLPLEPSDLGNSRTAERETTLPWKITFPISGLMLPILVRISTLPRSLATSMAAVLLSHRPAMSATFSSTRCMNSSGDI